MNSSAVSCNEKVGLIAMNSRERLTFQLARASWWLNELVVSLMVAKSFWRLPMRCCWMTSEISRLSSALCLSNCYQLRAVSIAGNCLINLSLSALVSENWTFNLQWRFPPLPIGGPETNSACQMSIRLKAVGSWKFHLKVGSIRLNRFANWRRFIFQYLKIFFFF